MLDALIIGIRIIANNEFNRHCVNTSACVNRRAPLKRTAVHLSL